MMRSQSGAQVKFFYSFNLDVHVPENHLLRGIDRCLDLGKPREHLAKYYSHAGRATVALADVGNR